MASCWVQVCKVFFFRDVGPTIDDLPCQWPIFSTYNYNLPVWIVVVLTNNETLSSIGVGDGPLSITRYQINTIRSFREQKKTVWYKAQPHRVLISTRSRRMLGSIGLLFIDRAYLCSAWNEAQLSYDCDVFCHERFSVLNGLTSFARVLDKFSRNSNHGGKLQKKKSI